jgi:hypothetical protein
VRRFSFFRGEKVSAGALRESRAHSRSSARQRQTRSARSDPGPRSGAASWVSRSRRDYHGSQRGFLGPTELACFHPDPFLLASVLLPTFYAKRRGLLRRSAPAPPWRGAPTGGHRPRLSKLVRQSSALCGSATWLCGRAPPFRFNSPLFLLCAGWKAQPSSRRRKSLFSTRAYGKAQPFRTAGGEAARAGLQVRT